MNTYEFVASYPCTTGAFLLVVVGALLLAHAVYVVFYRPQTAKHSEDTMISLWMSGFLPLAAGVVLFVGIGIGQKGKHGRSEAEIEADHRRELELLKYKAQR